MAEVIGKKTADDGYLVVVRLQDGTLVNEVTQFTGPGLGTDTDIECARPLSEQEQAAVLAATAAVDVALLPDVEPQRYPVRLSY